MDEMNVYREAFSQVRAPLSLRQALAAERPKRRLRGKVTAALVAAALLLLLSVSAAAGVFGTEIESWFSGYWTALTGGEMSEGQQETIDRLTTPVGQSQTVGDVTVTLDSLTTDGENLYLLITIKGVHFSKRAEYYQFDETDLFLRGAKIDSYGYQMLDITQDGTLRCLIDACFLSSMQEQLRLTLRLRDLQKGIGRNAETLQEGCWEFSCTVDAPEQTQALTCERAEVTSYDTGNRKVITAELRDIRLTAAGVSFRCRDDILGELHLLLKSGGELTHGGGERLEEDGAYRYLYIWTVPVDLTEVGGICIDGTVIPLS